jgi:hypothetical protein
MRDRKVLSILPADPCGQHDDSDVRLDWSRAPVLI